MGLGVKGIVPSIANATVVVDVDGRSSKGGAAMSVP